MLKKIGTGIEALLCALFFGFMLYASAITIIDAIKAIP